MPARNDEKLADFELSRVDERERGCGRIDDVPGFAMPGGQFTEWTWHPCRQLEWRDAPTHHTESNAHLIAGEVGRLGWPLYLTDLAALAYRGPSVLAHDGVVGGTCKCTSRKMAPVALKLRSRYAARGTGTPPRAAAVNPASLGIGLPSAGGGE